MKTICGKCYSDIDSLNLPTDYGAKWKISEFEALKGSIQARWYGVILSWFTRAKSWKMVGTVTRACKELRFAMRSQRLRRASNATEFVIIKNAHRRHYARAENKGIDFNTGNHLRKGLKQSAWAKLSRDPANQGIADGWPPGRVCQPTGLTNVLETNAW